MKILSLICFLLCAASASAQVAVSTSILWRDEGSDLGRARIVNCTGSGVTCSVATGIATVNAGGGGAVTMVETEVDFGASATTAASATVTDASVSATSKILVTMSGNAATGRQADENEMDKLVCSVRPGTGSFVVHCIPLPGPISGKYKLFYTVG